MCLYSDPKTQPDTHDEKMDADPRVQNKLLSGDCQLNVDSITTCLRASWTNKNTETSQQEKWVSIFIPEKHLF